MILTKVLHETLTLEKASDASRGSHFGKQDDYNLLLLEQ